MNHFSQAKKARDRSDLQGPDSIFISHLQLFFGSNAFRASPQGKLTKAACRNLALEHQGHVVAALSARPNERAVLKLVCHGNTHTHILTRCTIKRMPVRVYQHARLHEGNDEDQPGEHCDQSFWNVQLSAFGMGMDPWRGGKNAMQNQS